MATSLGAAALEAVAPIIAGGFTQRMEQTGEPLNILICENLKDAAHQLRSWLENALPEKSRPVDPRKLGLIEAAIGRMVPAAIPDADDPLHITVEEYGFLPVDEAAFTGKPPCVEGLYPFSPFSFYEERKLYLHNMGHAICAYLGMLYGFETIAQAVSDPIIRLVVQSAMTESAAMLSVKYDIPFNQIFDHAEDLLERFGNIALGDTCERVGRDTMRKLRVDDRLAGALRQCMEYDVHPVYIAVGYAAALRNVTGCIGQAEAIALETGRLSAELTKLVLKLFSVLDPPQSELLRTVERLKKELRGDIV
jgi:mannitol-1-phosphate 5-dehydrogenase